MSQSELSLLQNNLFQAALVTRLVPENILLLSAGELSPFSDYCGALVGIEKFLHEKDNYRKAFPADFERDYGVALDALQKNLFVPNHKTLRGGLNDRVRKMLQQEKLLGSSQTLEHLMAGLSTSQDKIKNLHRLGFSSSEKKRLEEELQQRLAHLADYGEVLQRFLFTLRPAVSDAAPDCATALNVHQRLYTALERNEPAAIVPAFKSLEDEIGKIQVTGSEINETLFYHRGQMHHSTKFFAAEWHKIARLLQQLDSIRENPTKNVSFSRSIPSFSLHVPRATFSKKAAALTLVGVLAGASVLYAFPSWRDTLGLPVSGEEKIGLLYDDGKYSDAIDIVERLHSEQSLDNVSYNFLRGKIMLAHRRKNDIGYGRLIADEADGQELGAFRERVYREIMHNDSLLGLIQGEEEEVLKAFFDAGGYVKKGTHLSCPESTDTPQEMARAHLCSIFEKRQPDAVEYDLLQAIRGSDVIYLGRSENSTANKQYFLTGDGRTIIYTYTPVHGRYERSDIVIGQPLQESR
ncbi:hypothetical protein HYU22_03375 [Candidatus Woesearchaeota archaeon]|nr:hypothetical protein [Candidatus Woesearchaeota archaeon]